MFSQPKWPPDNVEIEAALRDAWSDGSWGQYHGPHAPRLANELAEYHDLEFVRLCASGTAAVEMALFGLGVSASDEVILGGYDFNGNFRCIEHLNARPVVTDVCADSGCITVDTLEAARSSTTKAVIVSHLHGGLASMRQIIDWANEHSIQVLEDACQAHGANVDGRVAGTWGHTATLSFGGSKLMTAGRGGAVLTRDAQVAQRMKIYSEQGNDAYPMSELQAAVLIPQLRNLDAMNAARRSSAEQLRQGTAAASQLTWLGNSANPDCAASFYKIGWLVAADSERDYLIRQSAEFGAPLQAGFGGFHRRSDRRCRKVGDLPNSQMMSERLLLLHHPWLLSDSETLQKLCEHFVSLDGKT